MNAGEELAVALLIVAVVILTVVHFGVLDRLSALEEEPPRVVQPVIGTLPCTLASRARGREGHVILVLECPDSVQVKTAAPWVEEGG